MPYQPWPIIDYSGGMNNKLEDNLIADNQCVDVLNCISPIVGRLQSRPGQAKLNTDALGGAIQGAHAYHYGATLASHKLIVTANGVTAFWVGTPGAEFTSIKTGQSTTAVPTMFETCVNYMVAMNGVDVPWKYDGTTVSALANAPATGKCPVLFAEKLFCITDQETVKWSDSFLPETWTGANVWMFDKGDGDELVALFAYNRGRELLACKKRSIHRLIGTSLDDFRANKAESRNGVAGPRAGMVLDPYFYYISNDGIFRWDGLAAVNLTADAIPITWATVNKNALDKSVVGYVDGRLWFCVPTGAATTPDKVLVYDLKYGSWWIFDAIAPSCFVDFYNGTTTEVYSGHTTTGFMIKQNTGFNDVGVAISGSWTGKNFDGKDPVRYKKFKKAFAVDIASLGEVVFTYRLNSGSYVTPTAATDLNNVRKYAIASGKARFFQPKFAYSTINTDFALSGFEVLYKLKKAK